MSDEQLTYAKTIVEDLLGLRLGDALSINTEEVDVPFAKLVAQTALPITDVTVKIVVTNNGKPAQVLEFDPAPPAHLPRSYAMLRLSHVKKAVEEGVFLDVIVDGNDMGAIQRLGHLADPVVLDRRIAVPWCVAEVFDEDDDSSWHALAKKIALNIPNQSLSAVYRSRSLENSDIAELYFTGVGTDFSVTVPKESLFAGGHKTLQSGREFLTGMDFDRLSFLVDKDSVNGYFTADVTVMGRKQRIRFEFKDGRLVAWTPSLELERLLSFDEQLKCVGYISMRDNEFIVNLGGAILDALSDVPISEDLLPQWFNMSLYTLRCHLGQNIDICCTDGNGISRVLAKNGVFIE